MNLRDIYYLFSPGLRRFVRRVYYFPGDFTAGILGKKDPMIPPRGMIFTGSGDFVHAGEKFAGIFREYGNLNPDSRVLDIGCGIGRMAIPLTKILNDKGSYEGFDIVETGIRWCTEKITTKYPNFKFQHIDLNNDLYNLSTPEKASEYRFPYPDNDFDLVILTSVFTHMLPGEVENYLGEIRRVLKTGGRCVATFFVIDKESEGLMNNSRDPFFPYKEEGYFLHNKNVKTANIGFEKGFLEKMIQRNGLVLKEYLKGFWPGRDKNKTLDFQDIIVLEKK